MRITAVIVVLACTLGAARAAGAQMTPVAYLERVEVYGDADADAARNFVVRVIEASGYRIHVADLSTTPCRESACLTARAREARARIAVRATVLGLAGEVTVTFSVVDIATNRQAGRTRGAVDLRAADRGLTSFLRLTGRPDVLEQRPNRAAWILTGAAVALAAGAGGALWNARAREDAFFAAHVDGMGRVSGISRADAEAHEVTTRRWQVLGAVLLAGAAVAGSGATYLFLSGEQHAPSGVGVGVTGRF